MSGVSRRGFLWAGAAGLATLGAGGALSLRADAEPTPGSGEAGAYGDYLSARGESADAPPSSVAAPNELVATEGNILGPFYRSGAPYRGKVTPPLEPGTILLVRGRLWGIDTRKPRAGVTLDIWQANAKGRYDNDDPANPPAADTFANRTRLITDEQGRYEFETVHPGRYAIGRDVWRPAHIHYMVRHRGYRPLVTQLYFKGDPMNDKDQFIKRSLIIDLAQVKRGDGAYESGVFDIVLTPQ